jgi:hypothetical protein
MSLSLPLSLFLYLLMIDQGKVANALLDDLKQSRRTILQAAPGPYSALSTKF